MRFPAFVATALLLAATSPVASARTATMTVGADSSCDFHSLDKAVAAIATVPGPHRIRLARNLVQVLTDPERIATDVQLVGGYSSCADDTALGYTTVSVQRSPSSRLLASVEGVRFESRERRRVPPYVAP